MQAPTLMQSPISIADYRRANAGPRPLKWMEVWGGNERGECAFSVPGIDAWITSLPFEESNRGGDLNCVSIAGAGAISRFAIVDISGHGASVGESAARLRRLMRKHINMSDQTRFARAINQEFSRLDSAGCFATALFVTYFTATDHLIICNAGHPKPLWYHARTRTWELLDHDIPAQAGDPLNLPLGVTEPTDYVEFAVALGRGDVILMYTDSLIEAMNTNNEPLGEDGLLTLVRELDGREPARLNRLLLDVVARFRGGIPAKDDQTLMVLHHNAAHPEPFNHIT